MPRRNVTEAPSWLEIEPKLATAATPANELRLELRVVTPILGGGVKARTLDEVDVIRAPSIRGQLRFWWRALYGHGYETPEALYDAESKIWGGVAQRRPSENSSSTKKSALRSNVVVRIVAAMKSPQESSDLQADTRFRYALFASQLGVPQTRRINDSFTLRVQRAGALADGQWSEVRVAVAAFVLFGGLGSRTRRGLGSLAPGQKDQVAAQFFTDAWTLIRSAVGNTPATRATEFPSLKEATLLWLSNTDDPIKVFSDLRQGQPYRQTPDVPDELDRWSARKNQDGTKRAGVSNWPEPRVLRRVFGPGADRFSHPRATDNEPTVYPRSIFGLPIKVQWQRKARAGGQYQEPIDCILVPADNNVDRLASSLIVKSVWVEGGLRPVWLLLTRDAPPFGVAVRKEDVSDKGLYGEGPYPTDAAYFPFPRQADQSTELVDSMERWLSHHQFLGSRENLT